jgi:hypothetical protein
MTAIYSWKHPKDEIVALCVQYRMQNSESELQFLRCHETLLDVVLAPPASSVF